jgi:pectate lyase
MRFATLSLFLALRGVFAHPGRTGDIYKQIGFSTEGQGTTGGEGGPTIRVTTLEGLYAAVAPDTPKIVEVEGNFVFNQRAKIGNHTTIIGVGKGATIEGYGLQIANKTNVVVRNLAIHHVVDTDCISATFSDHIWVDHCELWSERSRGFDYYDGLADFTKGSDFITVSWTYFHHHWKVSLVGGDPAAKAIEGDKYHMTYHHNYFYDVSTRTPALRFGQAHVFNNYFYNITAQGVHPRDDGDALVEGNVFEYALEPVSTYGLVIPADSPNTGPDGDLEPDGRATLRGELSLEPYMQGSLTAHTDNIFFECGPNNITRPGVFVDPPYSYNSAYTPLHKVKRTVLAGVGVGKI